METPNTQSTIIAEQYDKFRAQDPSIPGRILFTSGVNALIEENARATPEGLLRVIREFNNFSEDNDPHGHSDFGSLTFVGTRLFWKIDLYDPDYRYGSEQPTNLWKTRRVLTVMLPQEY